ncbi:hypothetical protein [Haladaptatus sp. CMSO5]|uniref:hypothetical protein n=1 Tax=Haladaptatus sp. CMSO5 TaxID=3120514 RepID=UPI002FCE3DCE
MRKRRLKRHGLATVGLGLSIVFAVGAFGYLALNGAMVEGVALGVLVLGAGVWEFRRKVQDEIIADTYEAKSEANKQESRQ